MRIAYIWGGLRYMNENNNDKTIEQKMAEYDAAFDEFKKKFDIMDTAIMNRKSFDDEAVNEHVSNTIKETLEAIKKIPDFD